MNKELKILWLEDEPETISVIKEILGIEYQCNIQVCESFTSFSDEIEDLQDLSHHIIIIDIRMICNQEVVFTCFGKRKKIINSLDSGFEYFNYCIAERFKKAKIIFFSSKPKEETCVDAKKHRIDTNLIVSKECTTELINIIKDIQ